MKSTATLFLSALLLASAACAEDRLIPFEEFYLSVPVTDNLNFQGLRVAVQVQRAVHEPQGRTGIELYGSHLWYPERTLTSDELAALMEALNAALKAQPYHREVTRGNRTKVFETAKVDDHTRVRLRGESEVLFEPEETVKLKMALEQAIAVDAWFKKLLTEHTLPMKTAEAHPPKAPAHFLRSKVGKVSGQGLSYEVALWNLNSSETPKVRVTHGLSFSTPDGSQSGTYGNWVKRMMEQVVLALKAVERKEAFTCEALPDGFERHQGKFTVTSNLASQKADVSFDTSSFDGKHTLVQGSFAVEQRAEIREIATQGEALGNWLTEHEAWFLERP